MSSAIPPQAPRYAPPPAAALLPGPGGYYDGAADPRDPSRPLYGARFGQAIARFFRGYARFSGRASRSEYWWAQLFLALVEIVPLLLMLATMGIAVATDPVRRAMIERSILDSAGYEVSDSLTRNPLLMVLFIGCVALYVLGSFAVFIPSISVIWRRLHDANLAGPFFFLSFIYGVGGIIVLVLTLLESKPEGRRFDRF